MASAATRDKRIKAAEGRIEAAKARRTKAAAVVAEADKAVKKAETDITWLEEMPVDDDGDEETTATTVAEPVAEVDGFEYPSGEGQPVDDEVAAATGTTN